LQAQQFFSSSPYFISYPKLEKTTSKITARFQRLNPSFLRNAKTCRDVHYIHITQSLLIEEEQLKWWGWEENDCQCYQLGPFSSGNQASSYTLSRMWNMTGIV